MERSYEVIWLMMDT